MTVPFQGWQSDGCDGQSLHSHLVWELWPLMRHSAHFLHSCWGWLPCRILKDCSGGMCTSEFAGSCDVGIGTLIKLRLDVIYMMIVFVMVVTVGIVLLMVVRSIAVMLEDWEFPVPGHLEICSLLLASVCFPFYSNCGGWRHCWQLCQQNGKKVFSNSVEFGDGLDGNWDTDWICPLHPCTCCTDG